MAEQTRLTDAELEALRGHTLGPWRVHKYGDPDHFHGAGVYVIGVGTNICYVDPIANLAKATGDARLPDGVGRQHNTYQLTNAALIVAAPALLAEVIELRARDAAFAELVEATQRMRDNLRCVLSVNCKCDDEFIASQTAEVDAALAALNSEATP